MKRTALLTLFLFCACSDVRESTDIVEAEVWVCHNPDSEWHGSICNEECYWLGFQRSPTAYCWLLRDEDCSGVLEFEWQRDNCHFFGERDGEI